MQFVWKRRGDKWLELECSQHALVRTEPLIDGRYLWQFGDVVSFADSCAKARDYVEAGAEYYEQFKRNPYARV